MRRLTVVDRTIVLPTLPAALDGLRIAHVSDLHIGELITPDRLPTIVDLANRLRADVIAVTGDFVDYLLNVLTEVIQALGQLEALLDVFMVRGNHDRLEDGAHLIERFGNAGLNLLVNKSIALEYRGNRSSENTERGSII